MKNLLYVTLQNQALHFLQLIDGILIGSIVCFSLTIVAYSLRLMCQLKGKFLTCSHKTDISATTRRNYCAVLEVNVMTCCLHMYPNMGSLLSGFNGTVVFITEMFSMSLQPHQLDTWEFDQRVD